MPALRAAVDVQSFTNRLATTIRRQSQLPHLPVIERHLEGPVRDRGNARCGVDAPMFRDAAT